MPSRDKPKLVKSTPVAVWNEPAPASRPPSRPTIAECLKCVQRRTWLVAIAGLGACAGLLAMGVPTFAVLPLAILTLVTVVCQGYVGAMLKKLSPSLDHLADSLGLQHGQKAAIVVVTSGQARGCDRGIVVFEDGMMRFYGLRTTFRLSTNMAYAPASAFENGPFESKQKYRMAMGDHALGTARGFGLRDHPDAEVWVMPIGSETDKSRFQRQLYRWLASPPTAHDNSILPPLDLQPGSRLPEPRILLGFLGGPHPGLPFLRRR